MKKALIGVAMTSVLGIGGVLAYGQIDENIKSNSTEITLNDQLETISDVTAVSSEEEVKRVEIPLERTVDEILYNGYPWEYLDNEKAKRYQEQGETVYLFEDGIELEKIVLKFSTINESSNETPVSKEQMLNTWGTTLESYLREVSEYYPEKEAYFNKLTEVVEKIRNSNYEAIPELIGEASSLR